MRCFCLMVVRGGAWLCYMSYSLNMSKLLKGGLYGGVIQGTVFMVAKGDTRSSDYSSYNIQVCRSCVSRPIPAS